MYILLMNLGRFFKELSPMVTATVALVFAGSYIVLMSLGLDDNYEIYYEILMAVPAVVFLLWAGLKLLARRSQLKNSEFRGVNQYFRAPEKFGEIFDHNIKISRGNLKLEKALVAKPGFGWPASDEDINKLSAINAAAFRGTPWASDATTKFQRNLDMWHRNDKSFLMITPEGAQEPVFFSHILPLSDHGYHHYFETAEAGDNEFSAHWMAGPNEPIKGLLLFTIARDPDVSDGLSLTDYLYAVAYHIQAILASAPEAEYMTLYFQNSEKKFKRLATLAGFKKSRLLTYDEETVYVVSMKNMVV